MENEDSEAANSVIKSSESDQKLEKESEVCDESDKVITDRKSDKEEIIHKITTLIQKRHHLMTKNRILQSKLAIHASRSLRKEYFSKMNLEEDTDEWALKKLLSCITSQEAEIQNFSNENLTQIEFLREQIKQKKEIFIELDTSFKGITQKAAMRSVNSETGQQLSPDEVKDLLMKEEEVSQSLQEYQLHSIQRRHHLKLALEKKKNLSEGPLNFAEYEMMCIETQNNKEIIQPISEEIRSIRKKTANIINVLSHLGQKLYLAQKEKNKALKEEKKLEVELNEMRDMLFKEKMKYSQMKRESKELEHKFILLQHPTLIEDYNQLQQKNESAHKEQHRLKTVYEEEMKLMNK